MIFNHQFALFFLLYIFVFYDRIFQKEEKNKINSFPPDFYFMKGMIKMETSQDKYNWKLTDLFENKEDFHEAIKEVQTLLKQIETYKEPGLVSDTVRPNVILILAESFFRVDQLPNVEYNYDLFENTRDYIETSLISPSYGGRTAAAEHRKEPAF